MVLSRKETPYFMFNKGDHMFFLKCYKEERAV
jgi:hypothetical protein